MAIVLTDDKHYKNIANAIRSSLFTDKTYEPEQMSFGVAAVAGKAFNDGRAEGYDQGDAEGYERGFNEGRQDGYMQGSLSGETIGYEKGKQFAYDEFWSVFQNHGQPMNYYSAFSYGKFTDENYNPQYDIVLSEGTTPGQLMFYNSQISDTKVTIYANGNMTQAFGSGTQDYTLETIRKIVSREDTKYENTFYNRYALKNIVFEGVIGTTLSFRWCPLTRASIVSVVNALSGTVTGQTLTLNKAAKEAAFTADEWAALKATKSNWTIKDGSGNVL